MIHSAMSSISYTEARDRLASVWDETVVNP